MIKILGKLHFAIGLACLAWIAPCPLHAMDDETAKTIADLKAQMQALVDEVKQLKAQVATPAPTAPALPAPSATYNPEPTQANRPLMELPQGGSTETAPTKIQEGPGNLPMLDVSDKGLIFRSKDNRHSIRLGGLLQVDDREFADEGSGQASKFLIRRARPYVSGFFYDDWNFRFAEEFALSSPNATSYTSTIAEAFLNYKPINEIQFEAGKYKPPVALEQLATDTFLPFNERSVTSNLSPQRDVGFMTHGQVVDGKLSWAAMVGAGARNNSLNTGLDYDTGETGYFRLFAQPFKGEKDLETLEGLRLGVGGSIQWQNTSNAGAPQLFQNYTTDGGNTFFSFPNGLNTYGEHWRISPQLYYNYDSFSVLSEFIAEQQGVNTAAVGAGGGNTNYQSTAWNVTLDYVLTGEKASLDGIIPKEPFDFKNGTWGAWEMAIRYDGLAVGANAFRPVSQGGLGISATSNASEVNGFSWALNWYMNRIIRLGCTVEYNAFTGGGAKGTVVENNELGFITRLQLNY